MITIDHDIDACQRDLIEFFSDQVPFALSGALTSTAFEVVDHVRGPVWSNAFDVKNTALPKYAFKVLKKATKRDLNADLGNAPKFEDYKWFEDQSDGGVKTPRGRNIAIPVDPAAVRKSGGAVAKRMKPANLKRSYIRQAGSKKLIFEVKGRGKSETSVLRYVLQTTAMIAPTFPFYAESEQKALSVFSGHFETRFDAAIRSSRFFPVA
jgi:hypothetical protein